MKTDEEKLSNTAKIYEREFQLLDRIREIEQDSSVPKEVLLKEYLELGKAYDTLLKKTLKMTKIGDSNQKKLLTANEKIERQKVELSKAYDKMETLARTDPLTGLSNRRDFIEKLQFEITRFERTQIPFSIILCDIDDFKLVNDQYGHDSGDYVLAGIADIIKSTVRKQDIVGRWGGEEFILLLPDARLGGGKRAAEDIRKNIESKSFHINNYTFSITMTFGVSQYDRAMDMESCIKKADEALYSGKGIGKNRVILAVSPETKNNSSTFLL
jgi:diguanylate cyclase (GGDEF)-like protein